MLIALIRYIVDYTKETDTTAMASEGNDVENKSVAGDEASAARPGNEDETSHADAEASNTVATEEGSHGDDDNSVGTTADQVADETELKQKQPEENTSTGEKPKKASPNPSKKKKRPMPPASRKGRAPAVKGLTIPFRTVKKVK